MQIYVRKQFADHRTHLGHVVTSVNNLLNIDMHVWHCHCNKCVWILNYFFGVTTVLEGRVGGGLHIWSNTDKLKVYTNFIFSTENLFYMVICTLKTAVWTTDSTWFHGHVWWVHFPSRYFSPELMVMNDTLTNWSNCSRFVLPISFCFRNFK